MWHFLIKTPTKKEFERFDEETKEKIKQDIISSFDEKYGPETDAMISFETLIMVCVK